MKRDSILKTLQQIPRVVYLTSVAVNFALAASVPLVVIVTNYALVGAANITEGAEELSVIGDHFISFMNYTIYFSLWFAAINLAVLVIHDLIYYFYRGNKLELSFEWIWKRNIVLSIFYISYSGILVAHRWISIIISEGANWELPSWLIVSFISRLVFILLIPIYGAVYYLALYILKRLTDVVSKRLRGATQTR